MIVLYDIPSSTRESAWSPNTWKTRYSLNFKGLAYVTEWVEYPDIEIHSKKLGIKPTGKKTLDGSDRYTLPAIHDPSTGVYLADSIVITEYLDKTYPNSAPIFPHKSVGLQNAFMVAIGTMVSPIWQFTDLPAVGILNAGSAEYFRTVRERALGRSLEDASPKGQYAAEQWERLQENLEQLLVDLVMASYISWLKVTFGENDVRFTDIMMWDGGRWQRLYRDLQKFSMIQ